MSEPSGSGAAADKPQKEAREVLPPEKFKADNEKLKVEQEKPIEKVKTEKVEIKEAKTEKIENKENKLEKVEVKEKNEKIENKLELKEQKLEKIEVKERKPEFEKQSIEKQTLEKESVETVPPIDRETLLQHAQQLENMGRQLRHFIEQGERPDLSQGALRNEPDQGGGGGGQGGGS
jgi:hypothetical protein